MRLETEDTLRMNKVLRHRLRNFASGIRNAVTLLSKELDERLKPNEREYFPLIANECDEVRVMTDRLNLLFEPFHPGSEFPLDRLLSDSVGIVRERFPTCVFNVNCPEVLAPCRVCSNKHVAAILNEIVVNAVEARPGGAVDLICTTTEADLCIGVSDEGPGFSPEDLDSVMLPFFTKRPRHLGLGLAVARRLAEDVCGNLEINSNQESRCEVTLRLPVAGESADGGACYGKLETVTEEPTQE